MSDLDNLLEELVKNVSLKLDEQQKEIVQLRSEMNELKSHNHNDFSVILGDISQKVDNANHSLTIAINSLQKQINEIDRKKIDDINIQKKEDNNVQKKDDINDLTKLPAYAKTELFKEIRRPVNLNELYMVVLQSQRTINELQTAVDSILRRQ